MLSTRSENRTPNQKGPQWPEIRPECTPSRKIKWTPMARFSHMPVPHDYPCLRLCRPALSGMNEVAEAAMTSSSSKRENRKIPSHDHGKPGQFDQRYSKRHPKGSPVPDLAKGSQLPDLALTAFRRRR